MRLHLRYTVVVALDRCPRGLEPVGAHVPVSSHGNKHRGTSMAAVAMLKLFGIKDAAAKAYAVTPPRRPPSRSRAVR